MLSRKDHEMLGDKITEAVRRVCKDGLDYQFSLSLEGLIGVTLDDGPSLHIHMKTRDFKEDDLRFEESSQTTEDSGVFDTSTPKRNEESPTSTQRDKAWQQSLRVELRKLHHSQKNPSAEEKEEKQDKDKQHVEDQRLQYVLRPNTAQYKENLEAEKTASYSGLRHRKQHVKKTANPSGSLHKGKHQAEQTAGSQHREHQIEKTTCPSGRPHEEKQEAEKSRSLHALGQPHQKEQVEKALSPSSPPPEQQQAEKTPRFSGLPLKGKQQAGKIVGPLGLSHNDNQQGQKNRHNRQEQVEKTASPSDTPHKEKQGVRKTRSSGLQNKQEQIVKAANPSGLSHNEQQQAEKARPSSQSHRKEPEEKTAKLSDTPQKDKQQAEQKASPSGLSHNEQQQAEKARPSGQSHRKEPEEETAKLSDTPQTDEQQAEQKASPSGLINKENQRAEKARPSGHSHRKEPKGESASLSDTLQEDKKQAEEEANPNKEKQLAEKTRPSACSGQPHRKEQVVKTVRPSDTQHKETQQDEKIMTSSGLSHKEQQVAKTDSPSDPPHKEKLPTEKNTGIIGPSLKHDKEKQQDEKTVNPSDPSQKEKQQAQKTTNPSGLPNKETQQDGKRTSSSGQLQKEKQQAENMASHLEATNKEKEQIASPSGLPPLGKQQAEMTTSPSVGNPVPVWLTPSRTVRMPKKYEDCVLPDFCSIRKLMRPDSITMTTRDEGGSSHHPHTVASPIDQPLKEKTMLDHADEADHVDRSPVVQERPQQTQQDFTGSLKPWPLSPCQQYPRTKSQQSALKRHWLHPSRQTTSQVDQQASCNNTRSNACVVNGRTAETAEPQTDLFKSTPSEITSVPGKADLNSLNNKTSPKTPTVYENLQIAKNNWLFESLKGDSELAEATEDSSSDSDDDENSHLEFSFNLSSDLISETDFSDDERKAKEEKGDDDEKQNKDDDEDLGSTIKSREEDLRMFENNLASSSDEEETSGFEEGVMGDSTTGSDDKGIFCENGHPEEVLSPKQESQKDEQSGAENDKQMDASCLYMLTQEREETVAEVDRTVSLCVSGDGSKTVRTVDSEQEDLEDVDDVVEISSDSDIHSDEDTPKPGKLAKPAEVKRQVPCTNKKTQKALQNSKPAVKQESTDEQDRRTLFIKNFPKHATETQIQALSTDILAIRQRMSSWKNMRYAYLEFENEEVCEKNYQTLSGETILGMKLLVDYCGAKSKFFQEAGPAYPMSEKSTALDPCKLYITGFESDTRKSDLKVIFPSCIHLDLPRRKSNGQILGFAFAFFGNDEDAREAHDKAQGTTLRGCELVVAFSKVSAQLCKRAAKRRWHTATTEEPSAKRSKIAVVKAEEVDGNDNVLRSMDNHDDITADVN